MLLAVMASVFLVQWPQDMDHGAAPALHGHRNLPRAEYGST